MKFQPSHSLGAESLFFVQIESEKIYVEALLSDILIRAKIEWKLVLFLRISNIFLSKNKYES